MKKLLIIDDSEEFRKLVQHYVTSSIPDYRVIEYDPIVRGKPQKGFNWSDYEVLLLDYQLGSQDGLDWLDELIKSPDFPATIFLTAYGDEDIAVRAMKLGVHEYLKKQTLNKEKLINSIKSAIQLKSSLYPTYPSKRHFFDALLNAIATKDRGMNALLLVRCDQDSSIQDEHGFKALGNVISFVNKLVQKQLDNSKLRYETGLISESSIGLLLFDIGKMDLEAFGRHIVDEVYDLTPPAGLNTDRISVSVGITRIEADTSSPDEALMNADIACRSARILGGNSVNSYPLNESDIAAAPAAAKIAAPAVLDEKEIQLSELKVSLQKGHFQLYFQPLVAVNEKASQIKHIYDADLRLIHHSEAIRASEYIELTDELKQTIGIIRRQMDSCSVLFKKLKPSVRNQLELLINLPESVLLETGFWGWLLMYFSKHESLLGGHLTLVVPLSSVHGRPGITSKISQFTSSVSCKTMLSINSPITKDELSDLIGVFDFVKTSIQKHHQDAATSSLSTFEILKYSHSKGKAVVLDKINSAADLAEAIQKGADYVQGDYIHAAEKVIRKIDFVEEVVFSEPSQFHVA